MKLYKVGVWFQAIFTDELAAWRFASAAGRHDRGVRSTCLEEDRSGCSGIKTIETFEMIDVIRG